MPIFSNVKNIALARQFRRAERRMCSVDEVGLTRRKGENNAGKVAYMQLRMSYTSFVANRMLSTKCDRFGLGLT